MVKRKSSGPSKAKNGICQTQNYNPEQKLNASNSSSLGLEDDKASETDNVKVVYVGINSKHCHGDGSFDLAEVSLCDVNLREDMTRTHKIEDLSLRLRLSMPSNDTVRVGCFPLISMRDAAVEILDSSESHKNIEEVENDGSGHVLFEGHFDGTDEGVSGLMHLISLGLATLRISVGLDNANLSSCCRLQIVITKKAFDFSGGLSVSLRQPWRKSMVNMMLWLRPEVRTDEIIYGSTISENGEEGSYLFRDPDAMDNLDNRFDTGAFYEAIKRSKQEPMLEVNFPELVPELRPYQRRASYWMVQRERSRFEDAKTKSQQGDIPNPLCVIVDSSDMHSRMYYNPFSGSVSMQSGDFFSYVPGGILADEMGLGKTVELIACILAHPAQQDFVPRKENTERNGTPLKRPKIERVECICGALTESYKYTGLWVQCDVCDAWQHGDCVGFQMDCEAIVGRSSRKLSSKRRKFLAGVMDIEERFICRTCSELLQITESEVVSRATLIVCPAPILRQWQTEITRHTKRGSLKVQVYRGVKNIYTHSPLETLAITVNELASADIILTTYDVLKSDLSHDFDRHHGDRRSMRFQKRYPVVPTPLTKICWWRLCLDEAQMVETNTTAATEMAMRLRAQNLWCVTGTPIQRSLEDLYGLLRFLRAAPFDDHRWWNEVIKVPYERGNVGAIHFTHGLFRQFMWRSTKSQVSDELQLPPQEERLSWLTFSPIEAHFYKRQHESCAVSAREFIAKRKDDVCIKSSKYNSYEAFDSHLTHRDAAKLLNSLLKLRQACCHPQVGSSGLRSLQQIPMTMDEILQVLLSKAKTEGEESLRKVVVAQNGMAALAIIENNLSHAVSLYREAIKLVEEYRDDFRLDPLLNLHILHNLAEIIAVNSKPDTKGNSGGDESSIEDPKIVAMCSNSDPQLQGFPRILSEDSLMKQYDAIKEKYMLQFTTKLAAAREEFMSSYRQVIEAKEDCQDMEGENWWVSALELVEEKKDPSKDLMDKIHDILAGTDGRLNSSRLGSRFSDISGLKYIIMARLEALENSRKALIDRLIDADKMMDNPKDADVDRIQNCSKCHGTNNDILCLLCEMDDLFQAYENKLFLLKTGEDGGAIPTVAEALNLQKQRTALKQPFGTNDHASGMNVIDKNGRQRQYKGHIQVQRSSSELEVTLNVIKSFVKAWLSKDIMSAAKKHMLIFEAMRKEFTQARSLSIAQVQVMRAYDELKMGISRLRLRLPGEDATTPATLCSEELIPTNVQLTGEKFAALTELSRMKGQLRYLKGLSLAKQKQRVDDTQNSGQTEEIKNTGYRGASNEKLDQVIGKSGDETCPVCQDMLDTKFMVFPCGHLLCCKCMVAMMDRPSPFSAISHHRKIICPTCRYHTDFGNIAYVDDGNGERSYDEKVNNFQDGEREESSVIVQGSFGTKMEAVTRRIMWIKSVDPEAKILVFSGWKDVLDVLEHLLRVNDITYVRMKGGSSDMAISHFKGIFDEGEQSVRQEKEQHCQTKSPQVLLLLFRHGANGLNLLEAHHVILVEPLLNPAAEAQAINRVHRIGQLKKTFVHRLIVRETVEESIYKLNRSKPLNPSTNFGNLLKQDQFSLTLKDIDSLFSSNEVEKSHDESGENSREAQSMRDLRHLPPAVAAAIAAENRYKEASNNAS